MLMRLMWPRIKQMRLSLLLVLSMLPVSVVASLLLPYLTMLAVDEYIIPATRAGALEPYMQPLTRLMAVASVVVVLGYLADGLYVAVLQRSGQRLIADMRALVYRRTLRLPRSYFDNNPIGSILTRVTSDIEALGESLASNALTLVVDAVKTLAYLGMMFYLNWKLTLVLLVMLPVLTLVIRFFQVRVRKTFFRTRQALSEATGFLQECLSGVKTIQLFGAEKKALEGFRVRNHKFYKAQNESNFYDALLYSLVEGLTTLALALVIWYSAGELLVGAITLGVLVAFMEYIQRLFVPVREFSQQLAVLQRSLAALDHINALCAVPLDPAEDDPDALDAAASEAAAALAQTQGAPEALQAPESPGATGAPEALQAPESPEARREAPFEELVFSDVRFRYRDEGPEVLRGISFSVRKGESLAIVGATGSGKSTLIKLLTRAYSGYEGSIKINGKELNTLSAERLGRLIAVVHQGVFLYQGTVAFNIGMGREGMTPEDAAIAARYVHADGFISRMEGGYDAPISQGAANLSAGQAQLVSFARAVAAQTELIVLDEATASVDSLTENLIQKTVGRLYEDKTVIAIAHRLSTIRNADTILVMAQGEIIEQGNHAQLMAQDGAYAALVGNLDNDSPAEEPGPAAVLAPA